jgi:hypothetical protein
LFSDFLEDCFAAKSRACKSCKEKISQVAGKGNASIRLLKNNHLLRCAHPSSLRRTGKARLIPLDFARLASGCF